MMAGRRWVLVALLVLLGAAGCATVAAGDQEDVVRKRAEARWKAIVDEDYQKAYGYLSPGFRQKVNLLGYWARFERVKWSSGEVRKVECQDAEVCTVNVRAKFHFSGGGPIPAYDGDYEEDEKWIFIEGDWWYKPRR
jgi:hypothetical protein